MADDPHPRRSSGFGVGLGAVSGDDLGGGPVVGDQDPFAEVALFEVLTGGAIDPVVQPNIRWGIAGA